MECRKNNRFLRISKVKNKKRQVLSYVHCAFGAMEAKHSNSLLVGMDMHKRASVHP